MKVFKKKTLESFCTFAMFLMETTAEIRRLRFIYLFWKSVELGPYYPFYTKILRRNRNHIFQVKKFKTISPTPPPTPTPKTKKTLLVPKRMSTKSIQKAACTKTVTKSVYETKEM